MTDSQPPAPWQKVAEGHFERGLDPVEAAVESDNQTLDGDYNVSAVLKLRLDKNGKLGKNEVEQAWLGTRRQHPEIAIEFKGQTNPRDMVYLVPADDEAAKAWLASTLTIEEAVETADVDSTLNNALNLKIPGQGSATLSWIPLKNEAAALVRLSISHAIVDASGICAILTAFVQQIAEGAADHSIKWGPEAARLPPSARAALEKELGTYTPDFLEEGQKFYMATLPNFARPQLSFPFRPDFGSNGSGAPPRHETAHVRLALSQAESEAILAKCKSSAQTVTSIGTAAMLAAMQQLYASGNEQGGLVTFAANGRRFLQTKEKTTPESPSYATLLNFLFLEHPEQLEQTGSEINSTLSSILSTPISSAGFSFMGPGYVHMRTSQDWNQPGYGYLSVSSLGIVDRLLRDAESFGAQTKVTIEDFSLGLRKNDFGPWGFLYTHGEMLYLALSYSRRYFDAAKTEALLPKTREILSKWSA